MHRRAFVGRAAVASVGGVIGCAGYAWGVEPHWVEVVRRELPIENLPEVLEGASVVQISDLHVGREVDDPYLLRRRRRSVNSRRHGGGHRRRGEREGQP